MGVLEEPHLGLDCLILISGLIERRTFVRFLLHRCFHSMTKRPLQRSNSMKERSMVLPINQIAQPFVAFWRLFDHLALFLLLRESLWWDR